METLGAIILIAEHSNHNFEAFTRSFLPNYKSLHTYISTRTPSVLSKSLLIRLTVAVAGDATTAMNFHKMRVNIDDNRGTIAQGGYFEAPTPGSLSRGTPNVATS